MQEFPAPDNPLYAENLYEMYEYFRTHDPVHRESMLTEEGFTLFKYQDVSSALKDKRLRSTGTSKELVAALENSGNQKLAEFARSASIVLTQDAPEHTRIRKALQVPLRNYSIENLSEEIFQNVEDLLDALNDVEHIDLMKDFAEPLPFKVISKLLGVPQNDYSKLKKWSEDFALLMDTSRMMSGLASIGRTIIDFESYLMPIVEARRSDPRDDIISSLAKARYETGTISNAELVANSLFFLATNISTADLIGNCLHALLSHPGKLEQLRNQPQLMSSAIDEMLRYDSPFQVTGRVSRENLSIGGHNIPKGTRVRLVLGSANRDPEKFECPDELILDRKNNRHVSFGGGIHACLGNTIGKLECKIALERLLVRYKNIRLATDQRSWIPGRTLRGLTSLPVVLQ